MNKEDVYMVNYSSSVSNFLIHLPDYLNCKSVFLIHCQLENDT